MPFTSQELANVANATLDFYMDQGKVFSQTIQGKPLLAAMRKAEKTFPGGKENLSVAVKGVYSTGIQGFEHDDSVTYGNPANVKRAQYPWKLIHAGIKVTHHELLKDGISVVDSTSGDRVSQHSAREKTALVNLYEDKMEDMSEGTDRDMNTMYWEDGTQDSKEVPGITSIIVDDPTASLVVGGLDQAANSWWRNRADIAINISGGVSTQPVVNFFQKEARQLGRYGEMGKLWLAGSDMMDQIERELRANGSYTDSGWAAKGSIDFGMDDIAFKGKKITYDPTLDDLGYTKRMYVIDTKSIYPMVVEGENMKKHSPARPEDKYVMYQAVTWVGGLVCKRRNTSGVYAFA